MRALKEHWPRLIHNVLDSALERCSADLNAAFSVRGIYKTPEIRFTKANSTDMQQWHDAQQQENTAGTFNWHLCLEQAQNHPLSEKCDALIAIKSAATLCGLAYYRFHPEIDAMHIMQVERLAGDNPLKGNFSFVYLNAAVSLAHALDVETIKLNAPFYWNENTERKIRHLGFQNDENGDLQMKIPRWAKGFSYSRYSNQERPQSAQDNTSSPHPF